MRSKEAVTSGKAGTSSGKAGKFGAHRSRKRSPLWARLCLILGFILMIGSGGTLVTVQLTLGTINNSLTQGDLGIGGKQGRDVTGPVNVLLAGLDYRKDDPASEVSSRADSVMWMHIPKEHDRAYLLSFPRDLNVKIEPFLEAGYKGGEDRLNSAFAYGMGEKGNDKGREGGMRLLVKTVSKLTGITFDVAGIIDWYGFTEITKELGGVEMCLEQPIKSYHSDLVFPKGCSHYNEHTALELVRQRYDVSGGDYGRQKLQQQFVKQLVRQATKSEVIRNPTKINAMMKASGKAISLDLGGYKLADLVWSMRGLNADGIITIQVPHSSVDTAGDYLGEQLVQPTGYELFEALRTGQVDSFLVHHPELSPRLPA